MTLALATQLLFADLITTDAHLFAYELESQQHQEDKRALQTSLGIDRWQIWVQEGPCNEAFCIHSIESQSPATFCTDFKEKISHNRFASGLNDLFQRHLSEEYSLLESTLKVEKVLDLPIDPTNLSQGFDLCYLLPLLPDKVNDHREYCRAAMHEKRALRIASCKAFGMLDLKKWIQESPRRSYVLYYQKMAKPLEEGKQTFLALKDDPKALQATQTLRDQTGLTFEELSPESWPISLFP